MSNGDHLMEEWEEFKRFEQFQASRSVKQPEPEPEVIDQFKAYTQGPQGNVIQDHGVFARSYTPEQLEIHSTAPDRRFNDDPEKFYGRTILEERRHLLPHNIGNVQLFPLNGEPEQLEL